MDEDQLATPVTLETAKTVIETRFPSVQVETIKYLGGGSHSSFAVNESLLFRFPKIVPGITAPDEFDELFANESQLFPLLQSAVAPYRVPAQLFRASPTGDDFPAMVACHTLLPGQHVKHALTDPAQRSQIAHQLGDFLGKLHAIPPDQVSFLKPHIPTRDELLAGWRANYDYVRSTLFGLLTPAEQEWTTDLYETFLANAPNHRSSIVFTHGDFGSENVLYDGSQISVIDFDDVGFGDSVGDFCLWLEDYGADFLQAMLDAYPLAVDDHFVERATFYFRRTAFIYFNLTHQSGNPRFAAYGRTLLKSRMAKSGLR